MHSLVPEHTVLAQPKKQTQNLSVYIKEVKPSVHTLPQKYKIHVGRSQVLHLDCGAALPFCPALDRVNPKTRCDGARMPLRGEEEAGTHQLLSPGNKCDPDACQQPQGTCNIWRGHPAPQHHRTQLCRCLALRASSIETMQGGSTNSCPTSADRL